MNKYRLNIVKKAAAHILQEAQLGNIDLSSTDTYTCILISEHYSKTYKHYIDLEPLSQQFLAQHNMSYGVGAFIHRILKENHGVSYHMCHSGQAKELLKKYRTEWLEFIINY